MSNSSNPTSDGIELHIQNDSTEQPKERAPNKRRRFTALTGCCTSSLGHFLELLRGCNKPHPDDTPPGLTPEEARAYKELVEELDPKVRFSDAVKFFIRSTVLATFIAVLAVTGSLHKVHVDGGILGVKIHSWVGLAMLVVSGLPCIRLISLVVTEPMVWWWKADKYAMCYVRRLKKMIDVTVWLVLVLWVWYTWFRPEIVKVKDGPKLLKIPPSEFKVGLEVVVKQATRLLMAVSLGAIFWTLKKALYVRLRATLHYKVLCPFIRATILNFHAIQFIDHEKGIEWSFLNHNDNNNSNQKDEGQGASRNDGDIYIDIDDQLVGPSSTTNIFWMNVSHLGQETAPIWILDRLCYKYMKHMRMKPAILSDLEASNDDDKFLDKAKIMYDKFTKGGKQVDLITDADIKRCGMDKKDLDFVYKMFKSSGQDRAQQLQFTEDQFMKWAVKALRGCLRLERIISSSNHVFKKLDTLMSACVVVFVVLIWLLLSEIVNTAQLAILVAPFVSAGFVFGDTLKRTFDGVVFVFGMHPFNIDQRVVIDNAKMRVTKMRLLTTTFSVYETGDEIIYPNSVLATMPITKVDHAKNVTDSLELVVPLDTPKELISDLEVKIKKSLDDKLDVTSDTKTAKKISKTDIKLIVSFKYLIAYHSAEIKTRHRSEIFETIERLREEMVSIGDMEKTIENEKDKYEAGDIVKFRVNTSTRLVDIEELKKSITDILQGCESSKDCSKVLFTGIDKAYISIAVHIRYRKDALKPMDKAILNTKIVSEISAKGGQIMHA